MKNLSSLLCAISCFVIGVTTLVNGEVSSRGSYYVTGNKAIGFGIVVITVGLYFLYIYLKGLKSKGTETK